METIKKIKEKIRSLSPKKIPTTDTDLNTDMDDIGKEQEEGTAIMYGNIGPDKPVIGPLNTGYNLQNKSGPGNHIPDLNALKPHPTTPFGKKSPKRRSKKAPKRRSKRSKKSPKRRSKRSKRKLLKRQ